MANGNGWTPTEKRIMDLLRDGEPHHHTEMRACVNDELAHENTIHMHLTNLRKKLHVRGRDVLCQLIGRSRHYRLVRLISDPYSE